MARFIRKFLTYKPVVIRRPYGFACLVQEGGLFLGQSKENSCQSCSLFVSQPDFGELSCRTDFQMLTGKIGGEMDSEILQKATPLTRSPY